MLDLVFRTAWDLNDESIPQPIPDIDARFDTADKLVCIQFSGTPAKHACTATVECSCVTFAFYLAHPLLPS